MVAAYAMALQMLAAGVLASQHAALAAQGFGGVICAASGDTTSPDAPHADDVLLCALCALAFGSAPAPDGNTAVATPLRAASTIAAAEPDAPDLPAQTTPRLAQGPPENA